MEGNSAMSRSKMKLTEGEKLLLAYGSAFTIGAIILAFSLWLSGWDFYAWLDAPVIQTTLYFSAAIIRAVAGFGLIATYIAVFEILLTLISGASKARIASRIVRGVKSEDLSKHEKSTSAAKGVKISEVIKGEKISELLAGKKGRRARIAGVVFFLAFVPIFILAYVTLRFLSTLWFGAPKTLFDIAYLMVGVWGLLLTVYLLPIGRGDFITFEKMSDLKDRVREVELKKGLHSIKGKVVAFYTSKMKYQERPEESKAVDTAAEAVVAEHAKDYADNVSKIGFESVRETVLAYRHKLTDYLLLPVVLGSLIVPPVALLFLVVFGRAFFFKKEVGKSIVERIIVIGAVVMAGLWATVDIIFGQITVLVSFDYLIGTLIGVIFFIYLARKSI
jgi:hypothetical protein